MTLENIKKGVDSIYEEELLKIRGEMISDTSYTPVTWEDIKKSVVSKIKEHMNSVAPINLYVDVSSDLKDNELIVSIRCKP